MKPMSGLTNKCYNDERHGVTWLKVRATIITRPVICLYVCLSTKSSLFKLLIYNSKKGPNLTFTKGIITHFKVKCNVLMEGIM